MTRGHQPLARFVQLPARYAYAAPTRRSFVGIKTLADNDLFGRLVLSKPPEAVTAEASALDFRQAVGSSRVDLQACKLEYSIVSPK